MKTLVSLLCVAVILVIVPVAFAGRCDPSPQVTTAPVAPVQPIVSQPVVTQSIVSLPVTSQRIFRVVSPVRFVTAPSVIVRPLLVQTVVQQPQVVTQAVVVQARVQRQFRTPLRNAIRAIANERRTQQALRYSIIAVPLTASVVVQQ